MTAINLNDYLNETQTTVIVMTVLGDSGLVYGGMTLMTLLKNIHKIDKVNNDFQYKGRVFKLENAKNYTLHDIKPVICILGDASEIPSNPQIMDAYLTGRNYYQSELSFKRILWDGTAWKVTAVEEEELYLNKQDSLIYMSHHDGYILIPATI